jgi:type VI secretion system secreted protein Hcp
MLKRIVAAIMSLTLLLFTVRADAALTAFMKLKGTKTGEVKGSVTQKGREGMIAVIASSHEVVSSRDAASGMPTGKRQHKPFVITKEVDKSSPLLYNMLATNEVLPEVTIQYWRAAREGAVGAAGGMEQVYFTVTLTNATISSIKFVQPETDKPDTARLPETEEVSFTYQKIKWVSAEGNTQATDDWSTR